MLNRLDSGATASKYKPFRQYGATASKYAKPLTVGAQQVSMLSRLAIWTTASKC